MTRHDEEERRRRMKKNNSLGVPLVADIDRSRRSSSLVHHHLRYYWMLFHVSFWFRFSCSVGEGTTTNITVYGRQQRK